MSDILYPTQDGGKDPGFEAVRKKYGPAMVQRMRNWPMLVENHIVGQGYAEDDPAVAAEVDKAERAREHCRTDIEYALNQAASIARHLPKSEWERVPTVTQLRRGWNSRHDVSRDIVGPEGPMLDPAEVTRRFRRLRVGLERGLHGTELLDFTVTPQPFDAAKPGTPTAELVGGSYGVAE